MQLGNAQDDWFKDFGVKYINEYMIAYPSDSGTISRR